MIEQTRDRLKEWGKWAQGGYPSIGSMFRTLFGAKGRESNEMPRHIEEIDRIVCRAETESRVVLVNFYGRGGSLREKAKVLQIDRMTLRRRLDRAEWYVNSVLDGFEPES